MFFEFLNMSIIIRSQYWAVIGKRKWLKCPPNVNQLLAVWKIWGAVSCNKQKSFKQIEKSSFFKSRGFLFKKWVEFFFSLQCTLHRIDRNAIGESPKLISQKHEYLKTNIQIGLRLSILRSLEKTMSSYS